MGNRIVVVEADQLIELIKSTVQEVLQEKNKNHDQKQMMNFQETCDFLGLYVDNCG